MQSSQYVALFLDEAQILLEQCQECLSQLEQSPDSSDFHQELFRLIHTIKGMASTLVDLPYFEEVTRLTHFMETFLSQKNRGFSEDIFRLFSETFLMLQDLFRNIEQPDPAIPVQPERLYSQFEAQLNAGVEAEGLLAHTPSAHSLPHQQFESDSGFVFEIKVTLMSDCLMKSVRALLVLHNLEQIGKVLETQPLLEKLREGIFEQEFTVWLSSELTDTEVQDQAEAVSEIEKVVVNTHQLSEASSQKAAALPASNGKVDLNEFEARILAEAERQSLNAVWLQFHVERHFQLLSARIALAFRLLEAEGEIIKTVPGVQALETEAIEDQFGLLLITPQTPEAIEKRLSEEPEVKACFRIKSFYFGAYQNLQQAHATSPLETTASAPMPSAPYPEEVRSERLKNIRLQHLVRVDAHHLKTLGDLTGELLLARARFHQSEPLPPELHQTLQRLNQVSAALQSVSMRLQSITAAQIFNRYPRMIRDLARALNKEITSEIQGTQVEVSRTFVDDISNILLHMVRNAADHGLENPEERLQAGKSSQGKIRLSAVYHDHQVLITVEDDGRGINVQALKAKALQQNLLSQEQADLLSEQEALELIFRPGLSTSITTTDISGRGVGMDVVKTHIRHMGGSLTIHSEQGKGTRFSIILPSEVKQMEVLLVRSGQQYFALPNEDILQIQQTSELSAQDQVISLQHPGQFHQAPGSTQMAVELKANGVSYKILVDQVLGLERLAIKRLEHQTQDIVQGAALLNTDDLALYVEPLRLMELI